MSPEFVGLLGLVPPWALVTFLLGVSSAATFFVLFGVKLSSLVVYLAIGPLAALSAQGAAGALELQAAVPLGEVNVLLACGAAWAALLVVRILRL